MIKWIRQENIDDVKSARKTMAQWEWTDSGGGPHWFQTTNWSQIRQLDQFDKSLKNTLLESLLKRYWPPVFWYIQRKGYDHDLAKDLTQDFFHEVVLGKRLFENASPAKGRLRNFLLVALERYLITIKRRRTALKRRPDQRVVSLEQADLPEPMTTDTPEQAYCRAWAAELLDRTLARLCEICHRSGKIQRWNVFHDCILNPVLNDARRPSFRELCQRYGIKDEVKASNMLTTAKRQFRSVLRQYLQESVSSEEQIDTELMDLLSVFS